MTTPTPTRFDGVPAPAKLNLFLHITGRRADGYHELQSVFMLTDWCDRLDLARRDDGAIQRIDASPGLTLPANDLCVRAARALQAATGCRFGADIVLTKQIPAEAGLGGGSSDAASTLLALNRLWGTGLRRADLAAIGLSLGADVPFFIGGHHAFVEGVGERLTPLKLPAARFLVVKPPAGVSTQRIFTHPDLKRDTKTAILQGFAANDTAGAQGEWVADSMARVLAAGHNDLQPVAQALCPEIGDALKWLSDQRLQGRMSGSGSAVFALLPEDWTPERLTPAPEAWVVRVCSNGDAHPLADWCRD